MRTSHHSVRTMCERSAREETPSAAPRPGLIILLAGIATGAAPGDIIHVPGDQPTIQAGIDTALDGDQVVVAEGEYFEHIDFKGKAITVRSTDPTDAAVVLATVLNGSDPSNPWIVRFGAGETNDSVLSGLTVTGDPAVDRSAVLVLSSPTIEHCSFISHHTERWGGAAILSYGHPVIRACTFADCSAIVGGAISIVNWKGGRVVVVGCRFLGNRATSYGGAISSTSSRTEVTRATFTANEADQGGAVVGGGTYRDCTFTNNVARIGGAIRAIDPYAGGVTVTGSAFFGNTAADHSGAIAGTALASVSVSGSGFLGNAPDVGDFEDEGGNSFRFLPPPPGIPGDINADGVVDVEDLLILLAHWGA